MNKRLNNRQIYTILLIISIVGFWLFENFYTPGSYSSQSDNHLRTEIPEGIMPSSSTGDIVYHDHYTISYNEAFEQAEWVVYQLKRGHLTDDMRERPDFIEDPKVRSKSADWRNYRGSGFDRGHLCPAGDRRFSEFAYKETFYTSNITPQIPEFNAGVWNDLEKQVRIWCKKYGDLYVATGGVLKPGLTTIGQEDVAVPEMYFKVIARGSGEEFKVIGFLIPHKTLFDSYDHYVVPVDRIEEATGLNFFEKMPASLIGESERRIKLTDWPFTTIR